MRAAIPARSRSLSLTIRRGRGAPTRHGGLTPERFAHLAIEAPEAVLTVSFKGREIVAVEMPDGFAETRDPARTLARRILESAGGIIVRFPDAAPAGTASYLSVRPDRPAAALRGGRHMGR